MRAAHFAAARTKLDVYGLLRKLSSSRTSGEPRGMYVHVKVTGVIDDLLQQG
jgi:hypothetical protein